MNETRVQPKPKANPNRPDQPHDAKRCPECASVQLRRDERRGEVVCADCGLVLEDRLIDPGPEWRAFDSEQRDRRARTGAPATVLLHDKGLSTEIGWPGGKDGQGRRVPARNRAMLFRIQRWQRRARARSGADRSLMVALAELDRVASRAGLPRNVRETAAVIYRRAADKHLSRGRSIEGVASASLYAACRQLGVPRTLDEISEASRVPRKVVGRTHRLLHRELGLRLPPTNPLEYVPRFASHLELSAGTQALAVRIVQLAIRHGLANGKSPMGTAAAALYIASILSGQPRSQDQVAQAAGVTEVTIRNRYHTLAEALPVEELLPASGAAKGATVSSQLKVLPRADGMPRPVPPPGEAEAATA